MKNPIAKAVGFFVAWEAVGWNGTRSVFSWTVIRLNGGEGGGIWFQLSANPISHFIDLRGYCGVHAEKMKDVLFPNCESAGKSVIHWN